MKWIEMEVHIKAWDEEKKVLEITWMVMALLLFSVEYI